MTADEYWKADPFLTRSYRKAWEMKTARMNYEAWLQGMYFYDAMTSALDRFGHGLSGGKGKKPGTYTEHPFPITEIEREEEKQRKIQHTLEWFAKGQNTPNGKEG